MATSFRRPFEVVVRNMGQWVEGIYRPSDGIGLRRTVMATVQNPSYRDAKTIESYPWGKRAGRYIKIYCDERLNCVNQAIEYKREAYPGDIFYFDNSEYLIFGEYNFQMLKMSRPTPVSHWRYFACELIEGAQLEHVA